MLASLFAYKYYKNIPLSWVYDKSKLTSLLPEEDSKFIKGARSFFSILDSVGLHHKNGLYEIYGASIRYRQAGPLRVGYAEIDLTHDKALLFWQPDYSPSAGTTHLIVQFEDKVPDHGGIDVFLQMRSGAKYVFNIQFGLSAKEIQPKKLPALIPDELANLFSIDSKIKLVKSDGGGGGCSLLLNCLKPFRMRPLEINQ